MKSRPSFLVLLTFIVVATTANLHAQIAIYVYKGSAATIGGGGKLNATAAGSLAIDLNTYQATYIGLTAYGTGKNRVVYFQETPLQNFITTQIYGPKGTSYTVLAKAEAPGTQFAGVVLEQAQAVGLNAILTIQTLPSKLNWILPRSLKSVGLVLAEEGGADYLARESGTYTLSSKVTTSYNNAGLSVGDYVSFIRNFYIQKGIQEMVLPTPN
jgi:hypothetical protein